MRNNTKIIHTSFLSVLFFLLIAVRYNWGDGVDVQNYKNLLNSISVDLYYLKEFVSWFIIYTASMISQEKIPLIALLLTLSVVVLLSSKISVLVVLLSVTSIAGVLLTNNILRQGIAIIFLIGSVLAIGTFNRIILGFLALFSHNSIAIILVYLFMRRLVMANNLISLKIGFLCIASIIFAILFKLKIIQFIFGYEELDGDVPIEVLLFLLILNSAIIFQKFLFSQKIDKAFLMEMMLVNLFVALLYVIFPIWVVNRVQIYLVVLYFSFIYYELIKYKITNIKLKYRYLLIFILLILNGFSMFYHPGVLDIVL